MIYVNCIRYSLGVPASQLPQPEADWNAFLAALRPLNDQEPVTWNPGNQTLEKWIDTNKLLMIYQKRGGGASNDSDGCCTVM
jgi:hypothetical protein